MGKKKKPNYGQQPGPNQQKKPQAAKPLTRCDSSSSSSCGGCYVDEIDLRISDDEPIDTFPTKEMLKKFKLIWTLDYVSEEARNMYKDQEVDGQIPIDIPSHYLREVVRFEPVVPKQDRYRRGTSRQLANHNREVPVKKKQVLLTYEQAFSHEPGYYDHPGFNAMNPVFGYVPPQKRPPPADSANKSASRPSVPCSSRDMERSFTGPKSTNKWATSKAQDVWNSSPENAPSRIYDNRWNVPSLKPEAWKDWKAPTKNVQPVLERRSPPSAHNDTWNPGSSSKHSWAEQAKNTEVNRTLPNQRPVNDKLSAQESRTVRGNNIGPPPGFEYVYNAKLIHPMPVEERERTTSPSEESSVWQKPKKSFHSTSSSGMGKSVEGLSSEMLKMDITKLEFDEGYMDFH